MTFKAIIHEAEEGGFWAAGGSRPAGLFHTRGDADGVGVQLAEAIQGWLLAAQPEGMEPPERILEVAV